MPYNLVLQSNQFDTSWVAFQGATVTGGQPDKDFGNNAWKLNAVSTQAFSGLHQARTFTGVTTLSIFAKAGTLSHLGIVNLNGTGFAIWFNLSNGTIGTKDASVSNANMQNLGDGWYRCSFTQDVSAAGYFQLKPSDGELTPSTTSGFVYIQDAQLVKGDQPKDYLKTTDRLDIPRIDYTNGEPSILLEPQRQNLYTYSSAFTNITDSALTVTDNSTTSPENLTNATSLVPSTANTVHYLTFPNTSTGTVTFSVYAKSNGYNFIFLHLFDGSNGRAWFNLETGKVGTKDSSVTSEMIAMPNGWYRCSVTRVLSGSLTQADIAVSNADNTATFAGDGTSGVFVYGAQLEVGSYATSLIHTSGSAVTRSADAANNAGNSDLINSTEGVLYAEIKALADDNTFRQMSLNASGNNVRLLYGTTSNQIQGFVQTSSSTVANMSYIASDTTIYNKIAIKYKQNDFALWVNGAEQVTDTSGNTPSAGTLNSFDLNDTGGGGFPMIGNVKSLMVFKEALTDLELEKLTGYNNHELYMNYYNRLSYLGLAEEYNVESDINNYIL